MEAVEWPISAAKMTAELAISLVDRAYYLGAATNDLRQELLQILRSIQADLDRVEEGRLIKGTPRLHRVFRDVSSRFWSFRVAVERIEDTIDGINYRWLEEEVGNPVSKIVKRKVINKVTRLYIPGSSLKMLRIDVRDLLFLCGTFSGNLIRLVHALSSVETYGYPSWLATAEGVSGLEQEKEDLVQWLIEDTAEWSPFTVCALTGDADRKTTIVNIVHENPRVLANFDFIVWPEDEHREFLSVPVILQKINSVLLEAVTGELHTDMSSLEYSLRVQLRGKKLLLILDNVVRRDEDWEALVAPLNVCKKGSKILLMTTEQSLVDTISTVIGAAPRVMEIISKSAPSNVTSSSPKHSRYPSWISNGDIFGRDREREQLIQWLTMDTAEDNPFSVYAVLGMAGMGKTSLANIVCQDPRVSANFKAVVWVSVSVDFDTEAMTRFIFENITGRPPPYSSTNLLRNSLTEALRYRKVLLILDDVWEDGSVDKWQTLVAPLRVCKKGSRILLTTRMQSVVDVAAVAAGAQVQYLKIEELSENDNLMLFNRCLTSQVDSQYYDNLMLIGEQIAKKNGGCPLVTCLVASWLGLHMDTHHWNTVLQKGWQHLDSKYIVLSSLRLSYDRLPTELQTCFRYCSLFPKGYNFNKVELAKMWAGSGLLPFSSSQFENIGLQKSKYVGLLSAEVGEEYFDLLARKSLFSCMLKTDTSDGIQQEYYVLHDLIHDLAQHVSKSECARVDSGDLRSISVTTRHLSIAPSGNLGAICRHLVKIYRKQPISDEFTNLRTLIIQIEFGLDQETELVLGVLLKNSTSLRLLYLCVPSLFRVLDSVPSLIHLRYLFLFSCDEFHLQNVFQLYHLQVFKLEYLTAKRANCANIHSLRCLRCLHIPDNMSSMVHQIGRLTLLQELHIFETVENDGQRLSALGKLRSLCQLSLRNLQNVLTFKEAAGIKLKEKHHMKLLSLSWNKHLKEPVDQDGRIIDNLEPNREIQLLHIHGYSGVKLPVWIENSHLIHLVSLDLEYCMKWKNLPSLKELTSLKHLKLENLFQLEYIGTVHEQQFEIKSENAWLPPFLSTLTVLWCPKLKELPDIPCTLELLIIKHVQLVVLPTVLQRYTGRGGSGPEKSQLGFLHIESCAQLTSLNKGLLEQQDQLHSLKTLVLRHCERLHHLPSKGFAELPYLNCLEIIACPILRNVETEDHLLTLSLRNLDMNPCGDINVSVLMSLQNLTALRRLALYNINNVEELPSVEVFGTLNNINDVSIVRCKKLLSLGGLGAAAALRVLSILCCYKISSSYKTQAICTFKLQKLRIDYQALLSVEPLRSLRHTSELQICDDYAMESMPGEWLLQNSRSLHSIEIGVAESLRSLPYEIKKLESLQSLCIESAPLLQSLPQLPASLSKLQIWGCDPVFMKCYEREVGSDWGNIAHISDVDIQAYSECNNYADDQSQDIVNRTSNHYRQFIVID